MTNIHPTAIVNPKSQIGDSVTVGPFTIIEADVQIGDGTSIASHALIAHGARIGKNCKIHKGAVVSTIPQDLKFGFEELRANVIWAAAGTWNLGSNRVLKKLGMTYLGDNPQGYYSKGKPISTHEYEISKATWKKLNKAG